MADGGRRATNDVCHVCPGHVVTGQNQVEVRPGFHPELYPTRCLVKQAMTAKNCVWPGKNKSAMIPA
jgi:hypothetical protein